MTDPHRHRSAVTGEFVTAAEAKADPDRHVKESAERRPFWCHCAECDHEFYPFSLPIPVNRIPTQYLCPECNGSKILVGRRVE